MSVKLQCGFSAGLAPIRQSLWQNHWHSEEEAGFQAVTLEPSWSPLWAEDFLQPLVMLDIIACNHADFHLSMLIHSVHFPLV